MLISSDKNLWVKDANTPQTYKLGLEDGQKNEEGFVDSAPIPFRWESGNELMIRFLKTEASFIRAILNCGLLI